MFGVNSAIVKESLMLSHTVSKRNIIILAPATKGMQKKDRVLEALLDKLLTGIIEQEAVTIVKGVADLESINGIGVLGLDKGRDFLGSIAILVHVVVEHNALGEVHRLTRHKPWALLHDRAGTSVFG